jgi:hypothetical protein
MNQSQQVVSGKKEGDNKATQMFIKKNYFDNTAMFYYSLGVSFVHLALFLANLIVLKRPDVQRAKELDQLYRDEMLEETGEEPVLPDFCQNLAIKLDETWVLCLCNHLFSFITTLYREVREGDVSILSRFMRVFETIFVFLSFGVIGNNFHDYTMFTLDT